MNLTVPTDRPRRKRGFGRRQETVIELTGDFWERVVMEHEDFFAELTARLDGARALARELDRELAPRFNAFDYLRGNELGLSRVIADLLDPQASHGQGTLFLRTLLGLEGLKNVRHWPDLDEGQTSVVVQREREIKYGRRIDILVEIAVKNRLPYCLAIENKPYAYDQKNQVQDYRAWLEEKYPERFCDHAVLRKFRGANRRRCPPHAALVRRLAPGVPKELRSGPPAFIPARIRDLLQPDIRRPSHDDRHRKESCL